MALFRYYALTSQGKKQIGLINSDSIQQAKEELRKQQILITKLVLCKNNAKTETLPQTLLVSFTRDFHVLLRAGLPLYECLMILKEKYERSKAHSLLLNLCDQVKQGQHLSDACSKYPRIFDIVYLSMIRSGEESGTLTESFEKLEKLLLRAQSLRKKIMTAMIYPLFLGGFCLVVLSVLLFLLIPSMRELFEGREIHSLTAFILDTSSYLNTHASLLASIFLILIAGVCLFFKQKRGRLLFQSVCLKLPVISKMTTYAVLSRFSRVFSVLLRGGVSFLNALKLAKTAMHHEMFESIIARAERQVVEGKKLYEELGLSPLIPQMMIRMLSLAEESGDLAIMLEKIADIYEDDLDRSLTRMTTFLQPAILLFLGAVVALVLLAVLLPLTDVSSMI